MSSALEELAVKPPRPAELCEAYARRMDPWWGFAIAGALLTLGCLVVGSVVMISILPRLGMKDGSTGAQVGTVIMLVVSLVSARLVFTWWRRRRLEIKRELVRTGKIVEVTVQERRRHLLGGRTRRYSTVVHLVGADLDIDCGFNAWFAPAPGTTIKLLHRLGVAPVVAFDAAGRMYSGLVLS